MQKAGKKFRDATKLVDKPTYSLTDAMPLLKKTAFAKFDETVDVAIRLGVDPKHADQMVRGTVVLPHGLGKTKRVVVIASGDKVREGREGAMDCRRPRDRHLQPRHLRRDRDERRRLRGDGAERHRRRSRRPRDPGALPRHPAFAREARPRARRPATDRRSPRGVSSERPRRRFR